MSERARLFADGFAGAGEMGDRLHIYHDGYILILTASADRHLAVRQGLRRCFPAVEEARSSDGLLSAFVLPDQNAASLRPEDVLSLPADLVVCIRGYVDHRAEDAYTLEGVEDLFRRGLAARRHRVGAPKLAS
jgi:hypothetical protein